MSSPQPDRPWERDESAQAKAAAERSRNRGCFWVGLATVLLVAGCAALISGGGDEAPDDVVASQPPSKYEQTWFKSYSETTCGEWRTQMTPQQQFAAAADMLTAARNKGDGGSGLPSDLLIRSFEQDIDEGCSVIDSVSVAETGASIYLIGREQYRP